jgi:peroxiredoxin
MSPVVGEPAPAFTLPSTSGTDVTLAQFRGKSNVLLAFFPLAFASTCTAEMTAFSEDRSRFEEADAVILPVSVDSIPALREFMAKEQLTLDLLSDFKREVCRAYGTLLEDKFFSRRAYFLIDKHGILRWSHTEVELGHRRDNDELLAQIAAL